MSTASGNMSINISCVLYTEHDSKNNSAFSQFEIAPLIHKTSKKNHFTTSTIYLMCLIEPKLFASYLYTGII